MLNNVRFFGFVSFFILKDKSYAKIVYIIHEDMSYITTSLCCPWIFTSLSQPLTFLKNVVIVSVPGNLLVSFQSLLQHLPNEFLQQSLSGFLLTTLNL